MDRWDALSEPWRAVARQHGFIEIGGGRPHPCVLLSGATFLDLCGDDQGVRFARLVTWIDAAEARFSLRTIGEADPPPRPPGVAGWLAANVVRRLMRKLAPQSAPALMRAPGDLGLVIQKHIGELMATGGKPVLFEGDPLQARFAQEERDDAVSGAR